MSTVGCRFRPWLDHLAGWPEEVLDASALAALRSDLTEAAAEAIGQLRSTFGDAGDAFGATGLAARLAAAMPDADALRRTALAVAACDHFNGRIAPPRASAGGLTNRTNARRWAALRPYLQDRAWAALRHDAAAALVWQAVLDRVPDNWIPAAQIGAGLRDAVIKDDYVRPVAVRLDAAPPVVGGRRWIAAETRTAFAGIRDRLGRGLPCPVALMRDATAGPSGGQVVVVFRMAEEAATTVLTCHDPALGGEIFGLRLRATEAGVFTAETRGRDDRGGVRAMRLLTLDPADPPLFGLRRLVRWAPPWRALWWLKRLCLLWLRRRRDRAVPVPGPLPPVEQGHALAAE